MPDPDQSDTRVCDVSVVIPAYRAEATIAATLRSVFAQTLKPREIVIVDDGSDDGTLAAIESVLDESPGIALHVLQQENRGAGAARNAAIAHARATYIAFIDADDVWLPAKLERSMHHIETTGVTLSAHDYFDVTPAGEVHVDCVRRFNEPPDPYTSLYIKGYIPSCSVVAERDAINRIGGFDDSLRNAQDFELWLRLLRQPGARFEVFGEPLLKYHHSPGGIMSFTERRLTCCTRIAVMHYDAIRARARRPLGVLLHRLAAIHVEAFRSYIRRGMYASALGLIASALVRIPKALLAAHRRNPN